MGLIPAHGLKTARRAKALGLILLIGAASLATALFVVRPGCPASGLALTPGAREAARLKNRDSLPRPEDFDQRVTLATLTEPGDDRRRWSEARAAAVEGYVVEVKRAGAEAANCFSPTGRDTHIHLAARPEAPARETVVLEVTPRLERWAARQGLDWSEAALRRDLLGRWCRFEGWLFFDAGHAGESENLAPGAKGNWRATAWEVHPVTRLAALR
jgi:hypothetical protein